MKFCLALSLYLLSFCFLCLTSYAQERDLVPALIEQIEGKHCKYYLENNNTRTSCRIRNSESPSQLSGSKITRDCICRGMAAGCLGNMEGSSAPSLKVLHKYLADGPSDIYTGENFVYCLTPVINAIGKIHSKDSIPVLMQYLQEPRLIQIENVKSEGFYTGISAAISSLMSYGKDAAQSVEILKGYLTKSGGKWKLLNHTLIVKAISVLGGSEDIDFLVKFTLSKPLFFEPELKNDVFKDSMSINLSLHSLNSKLKIIRPLLEQQGEGYANRDSLFVYFQEFKKNSRNWIESVDAGKKVPERALAVSLNQVTNNIKATEIMFVRMLAKMGEERILEDLPELLLSSNNFSEDLKLISNFGSKAEFLAPKLLEIINELNMRQSMKGNGIRKEDAERAKAISNLLAEWSK